MVLKISAIACKPLTSTTANCLLFLTFDVPVKLARYQSVAFFLNQVYLCNIQKNNRYIMLGFLSKMFGGSKSEKDINVIRPLVDQINKHFTAYQSLSNDQLRNKTQEFRSRIKAHLEKIDSEIASLNTQA